MKKKKLDALIKVKDKDGNVYSMPSETDKCILEIHYCTSYIQFIVQDVVIDDDGNKKYPTKNIVVILDENNWIDLMAIKDNEIGELVKD